MILSSAAALCIVAFVSCAFVLRARMIRLHEVYETRIHALHEAERSIAAQVYPSADDLEAQIRGAAGNAAVMRKNATLFRLLWPREYDSAFYAGERLIAQASRVAALSSR